MPGLDERHRRPFWFRSQTVTKGQAKQAEKESAERIQKEIAENAAKKASDNGSNR